MIRNVLVMKSGLVLFSREFANTVQQVSEELYGASNMIAGTRCGTPHITNPQTIPHPPHLLL